MKKKTARIVISVLYLVLTNQVKAQLISIGQSAEQVKFLIEWETKDHSRIDTYGHQATSIWTSNVKYNNGKIIEVIQCCQNQYMYDLRVNADYCKHFVMANNKLQYILTQFENISKEKLIENFNKQSSYFKIDDLFFAPDCETYSKIYIASNGLATIRLQKTNISELPINIQKAVNLRLTTLKTETKKKQKEVEPTELTANQEKEIENYKNQLNLYYTKLKKIDAIRMSSKEASGRSDYQDSSLFKIPELNITILPNGTLINNSNSDTLMRLNIKKDFIVTNLFYIYYKSDLIVFAELYLDEEEEFSSIQYLDLSNKKVNWFLNLNTFNGLKGLIENSEIYITGTGEIGKISLKSGKFIWNHEALYQKYRCNNFVEISTEKNLVRFTAVDEMGKSFGKQRFDKIINFICDKGSGKIISVDNNIPYTDDGNFKPVDNDSTETPKDDNSGKLNSNIQKESSNSYSISILKGLQGRFWRSLPSLTDKFNGNAKVAEDIHIDASGNVISVDYQPRGSTNADVSMKAIALSKAQEIKFNTSSDESVGTILFNFEMGN